MRKPSLTIETFVTALAVLGATTTLGCSKSDRATAAPEAVGAPAPGAPAQAATGAAAPADPATTTPLAAPEANKEKTTDGPSAGSPPPPAEAKPDAVGAAKKSASPVRGATAPAPKSSGKSPSASCGAGTCTPEMKKGNGN